MTYLAITFVLAITATCRNKKVYEKLNFSGIVVKAVESHFACSAVYCKRLGQQKKRNDSFQ